jgi:hypothetical protein
MSPNPAEVYARVDGIDRGDWAARDDLYLENLDVIHRHAKAADQVFVCWGAIARPCMWLDHVIEEIQTGEAPYPDLWCWGKTAYRAPKLAQRARRTPIRVIRSRSCGGLHDCPRTFSGSRYQRARQRRIRAGLSIAKIEIDPTGKIVIIPGIPEDKGSGTDEWDARIQVYRAMPPSLPTAMGPGASGSGARAGRRSMSTRSQEHPSSRKPTTKAEYRAPC